MASSVYQFGSGTSGVSGTSGSSGVNGAPGAAGSSGTSGVSGSSGLSFTSPTYSGLVGVTSGVINTISLPRSYSAIYNG